MNIKGKTSTISIIIIQQPGKYNKSREDSNREKRKRTFTGTNIHVRSDQFEELISIIMMFKISGN